MEMLVLGLGVGGGGGGIEEMGRGVEDGGWISFLSLLTGFFQGEYSKVCRQSTAV